jgi:hypothetical protein
MAILSIGTDAKTVKGEKIGVLTGILYLAPSDESGALNTCPDASAGCRKACLFTAGRGNFKSVKAARVAKTVRLVRERLSFLSDLVNDIRALDKKAKRKSMVPAVRLNGTSDLAWERIRLNGQTVMDIFPHIQFYDYTKDPVRMLAFLQGKFPANYHLTFSRSEDNQTYVDMVIRNGGNVAVVFRGGLPATWQGRPVIDGDLSDVRFSDPAGSIVGLKAKGRARKDEAGFVVQVVNLKAAMLSHPDYQAALSA